MTSPATAWQIARAEALGAVALRQTLAARIRQQRQRLADAAGRLSSTSTGRAMIQSEIDALSASLAALALPGPGCLPERQLSPTELRARQREALEPAIA